MDRIIATSAVTAGRIPYPWVEQADEGDTVLYPWGTAFQPSSYCSPQPLLPVNGRFKTALPHSR